MGTAPSFSLRKTSLDISSNNSTATRHSIATMEALAPEDFADVFGGPPRTVLSRRFSGDFYEEIFRPPQDFRSSIGGRSLPSFRIPYREDGLFSNVFRPEDCFGRRSRERSRPSSKTKSKSSSEEVSPLRPAIGDDVALSSFASKLRPINVRSRWNTEQARREAFGCARPSFVEGYEFAEEELYENTRSSYCGFSRRTSSPETLSVEPNSYRSMKICSEDLDLVSSPNSSPVSSVCQEPQPFSKSCVQSSSRVVEELEPEDEEDDAMSSYVIEITTCDYSGEAVSVDEAIAWAKEKFQSCNQHDSRQTGYERCKDEALAERQADGHGTMSSSMEGEEEEKEKEWKAAEGKEESEEEINKAHDSDQMRLQKLEMEMDEDIRLWSLGKETNIKLLLSTLHHILWPNSGWYAISITNLKESSQVKKAYQKARLCLHPDKLQQKGATPAQKYIAQKAFSILQDAWSVFISQDTFFK